MPLTTRSLFKAAYGDAADSDLLDGIIPQASRTIERHLNRSLEATTYRRWFDGTGCNRMFLTDWPITRIYRVANRSVSCLRVTNSTASMATVMVDETAMRLFSVSTAGVETDSEILLASFPTVTLLHAQIETLSGWTATIENTTGNLPSSSIRPQFGQYAVSPTDATIECADESDTVQVDVLGERMIERVSGITSTTVDFGSTQLMFAAGVANVFVWWKAGYTFPVDDVAHTKLDTAGNVPAELTMVCNAVSKGMLDTARQEIGAAESANITDFSYSLTGNNRAIADKIIADYANTLNKYRRFL